jgi:hypothetical protein
VTLRVATVAPVRSAAANGRGRGPPPARSTAAGSPPPPCPPRRRPSAGGSAARRHRGRAFMASIVKLVLSFSTVEPWTAPPCGFPIPWPLTARPDTEARLQESKRAGQTQCGRNHRRANVLARLRLQPASRRQRPRNARGVTGRRPDPIVAAGTARGTSPPSDLGALKGQTKIVNVPAPTPNGTP